MSATDDNTTDGPFENPATTGSSASDASDASDTTADLATPDLDGIPALAGARVLVIEDEAPVANFLSDALTALGARVILAAEGDRGLELFLSEEPDLVICDLLLPKRNGFRLMDDFRQASPSVPIVAMSGIYRNDKYTAELAHAKAFLTKPLDMSALDKIVDILRDVVAARSATPAVTAVASSAPTRTAPRGREAWVPTSVIPLARMLHLLWRDRRTGLLTQRSGERTVVFLLKEGRLRFVRCNEPEQRLDRVLAQLGKIAPADLQRAQSILSERTIPTRLGEVLLEEGMLTKEDLDKAVQLQLRRIIASAFNASAAETMFRVEELPEREDIVLDSDLRAIILGGCLATRDDGELLLGHLPEGACLLERVDDGGDGPKLPAAVQRLLDAITGPTRLSDIIAMADLVGLRGRHLVFGLLCAEALRITDATTEWRHGVVRGDASRSLSTSTPCRAFLDLEEQEATGVLNVTWDGVQAWVAFENGAVRQAASTSKSTRLGERLQTAGLLTQEQLHAAVIEQSRRPGRPIGQVLIEMGALDSPTLPHAVRAQVAGVAREVAALPSWDDATFTAGATPEREPVELDMTTSEIVLEALRESDGESLSRLVSALAPGRNVLDLVSLRSGRFALSESEELVSQTLGASTEQVMKALAAAPERDADIVRVFALALLLTPVTGVQPTAARERMATAAPLDSRS